MKRTISIILAVLVVGLVVFFVVQALDNNENNEPTVTTGEQQSNSQQSSDNTDTLSQITENPANYYGKKVTVAGEIQDLYSQRVFKISDQTIGDELLVLTGQPLTAEQAREATGLFEDNADVRVNGTVRQLVIADVEREFGLDFPSAIEVEYRDRPLLVADSFTFSDSNAVFDFTQGSSQ